MSKVQRVAIANKALKKDLDWLIKKHFPHWTDNNVHDPGVALLELLVYAIDDLAYRRKVRKAGKHARTDALH